MKLNLTEREIDTIKEVLFEYRQICNDGLQPYIYADGSESKPDKSSESYFLARAITKVLNKMNKQLDEAKHD